MAAILGGLIGARTGRDGIPRPWLDGLWEWPRSEQWISKLGKRLWEARMTETAWPSESLAAWALPLRSMVFTAIMLAHAFRRLLPPY